MTNAFKSNGVKFDTENPDELKPVELLKWSKEDDQQDDFQISSISLILID